MGRSYRFHLAAFVTVVAVGTLATQAQVSIPVPGGEWEWQGDLATGIGDPGYANLNNPPIGPGSESWSQPGNPGNPTPPGWTMHMSQGATGNDWPGLEGRTPTSTGFQSPSGTQHQWNGSLGGAFGGNFIGFMNLNTPDDGTGTTGSLGHADSDVLGTLGAEFGQDSVYTLDVAVGMRSGASWRDVEYSIGLVTAAGVELGTFSSVALSPPPSGTFLTQDLTYTLDLGAEAAEHLGSEFFVRITMFNTGEGAGGGFTQANFDNVRLQVVPEPSSLALLGLGGLALLRRRSMLV